MLDLEESMRICVERQDAMEEIFRSSASEEMRYAKIIEMGRSAPPLDQKYKIATNEVPGCQSLMYLHTWLENGNVRFQAESEALISSGLAQLLIEVYDDLRPEVVLKCPPDYLENLQIRASLSPNRANGLYAIHLKMRQEALKLLVNNM